MIQFLLNNELRTEHSTDPNLTVLNYLREHLHKSGTKEGCASGDCGACTVVVGELETDARGEDSLRYRSLNSCLTFVASLHGKQLISVEDLKHQGKLHSVQQAMVDCHGSQCGFCTPVLSCRCLPCKEQRTARQSQNPRSAGGQPLPLHWLSPYSRCRRTIVRQASAGPVRRTKTQTIARLRDITPTQTGELNDGDKRCLVPQTVADLAQLYEATHRRDCWQAGPIWPLKSLSSTGRCR